jgi:hypothetical protein
MRVFPITLGADSETDGRNVRRSGAHRRGLQREALRRRRQLQLRFAPNTLALGALVRSGSASSWTRRADQRPHTPWDDWPFLAGIPRHEVLYHSVRYLDGGVLRGRRVAERPAPRFVVDAAFEGPMSNLQRFAAHEDAVLVTRVDDLRTMDLVERCYSPRGAE